jgi:hypothetical protein
LILKHLDFRPHKGLQISICICEERISSLWNTHLLNIQCSATQHILVSKKVLLER